eukprot:scaffold111988_cov36-Tisochrysis_lutea.AAC.1
MPTAESRAVLAGAVAGVAECIAVQPLDMVKTRFQLVAGPGSVRPTVFSALRQLVREGGIPRLYRGILPELAAMTPKSSAMYSSYQSALTAQRTMTVSGSQSSSASVFRPAASGDTTLMHFLAGAVSGVPEAVIVTPFQVVKVRLQAREHLGRYTSTMHCLRTVLAEEGVLALSAGFYATCWRNCAWNSVYFASMHVLRGARIFGVRGGGGNDNPSDGLFLETLRTAILGFAAGVFATCFNAPFDVAKSRLQAARQSVGDGVKDRVSLRTQLRTIYAEEGFPGLYAGFTPKAMRMGLGGAVGIAAFELTMTMLHTY